jgi:hypothetical protein
MATTESTFFDFGVPSAGLGAFSPRLRAVTSKLRVGDTEEALTLGRVTEEHSQRNDKHADLLERGRANGQRS